MLNRYGRKGINMSILDMDKKIFDEKQREEGALLVEFWAPWCVYCKRIGPAFSKLAEQYEGKLQTGKINIDDEQLLAIEHGVTSIPTLMLFKDGHAVKTLVGLRQKNDLMAELGL